MADKMKAVVKVKPELNGTELMMVDIPKPGPNDVLIKVKVASICGTDVHIFNWDAWAAGRIKTPLVYGHEFAGEVVEVGNNVDFVKVGDYVSGECHIACGHCMQCRTGLAHVCQNTQIFGVDVPGIFAEYACIPAANVWHNDPEAPAELCSIQDPLGNAVHSIFASDVVGKDVAVLGVGPIGAMCVSICKHIGAANVFAVGRKNEYRIELAKKVGADYTYKAADDVLGDVLDKTGGKGVDVVLEMSGNANAIGPGLDLLRTGGDLILLGVYADEVTLDFSKRVVFKYATIKGINGRRMFDDWYRMKGLLKNPGIRKDLDTIITHRFKFDQFQEAMETMRSGNSGKVVLEL
ncbi:MAG: L-threonine 3-dehydrogenase [Deltaproteobacteria bacterium]|jgi:threonine 3-dehydrogenase|nr:L-threonine 3-dehydrogenase [Deltaproteobacteria bacterium]